jgi:hypothetical protein
LFLTAQLGQLLANRHVSVATTTEEKVLSKYVELETHVGIHLLTKKEVVHEQYFVYINDDEVKGRERVGLIGWKPDSKLVFTSGLDPTIKKWVEEEVALLISRDELQSVPYPQETAEKLSATQGVEDELDEKDLT